MAPFLLWPYMRLIHAHIMLVNLHVYNVIQVSFRYHFWDSYRAIMPMYSVHFMGQSVFTKLELLHILMDGHSAVLSNERKLSSLGDLPALLPVLSCFYLDWHGNSILLTKKCQNWRNLLLPKLRLKRRLSTDEKYFRQG
jgi:hypothetical protein